MTSKHKHPSQREWSLWIDQPDTVPNANAMAGHLEECAACRFLVETLRSVGKARSMSVWEMAPDSLVDRVLDRPYEPAILPPKRPRAVEWQPLDVRGGSAAAAGSARMASRVFDEGEAGIVAIPPSGDGIWHIQGTVWLRDESDAILRVALVHDDHVIASIATTSGKDFELLEAVGEGWQLEIHLPGEQVLILEEPDL